MEENTEIATALKTVSGDTLSFSASGSALQNRTWSCINAWIVPDDRNGPHAFIVLDQLNAPLVFTEFSQEDGDADKITDDIDRCPTVAGTGPTGCPPSPPPSPLQPPLALTPPPPSTAVGTPPAASSVRLASTQRGWIVRGSLLVARAGSRLDVQAFAPSVSNSDRASNIRVGRLTRESVVAGRSPFAVRLDAAGRRALARSGRLRLAIRVRVTPRSGAAYAIERFVTLRKTRT